MAALETNPIVDTTFRFALQIIKFTRDLENSKKYNLANQLFRCGTSIGANVREAQSAESRADFIHKMKIAHKEAEETRYWLELCQQSDDFPQTASLLEQIDIILKILGKIITSTKIRSKL